jgi:preprotein translocase subunit SecG
MTCSQWFFNSSGEATFLKVLTPVVATQFLTHVLINF